jgi:hypothetical protein
MNFILRTIRKESKGQNLNRFLGNSYCITYNNEKTTEEWEREVRIYFPKITKTDNIVAIVLSNEALPIYNDDTAYIMTESGKTFEKIK